MYLGIVFACGNITQNFLSVRERMFKQQIYFAVPESFVIQESLETNSIWLHPLLAYQYI